MWGVGFKVWGLRFMVYGLWFMVCGLWSMVEGSVNPHLFYVFRVWDLGFGV